MEPLTHQEVYNKVRDHLLTQNKKAEDESDCRYRTPDGLKCAVGCLIPDELYTKAMEGRTVRGLFDGEHRPILIEAGLNDGHLGLLTSLQHVHDCEPVENWSKALRGVARNYGLEP